MTKLISAFYLLLTAFALTAYFSNGHRRTRESKLLAFYLLVLWFVEMLTTFLLPRGMTNHFVYAYGFLLQLLLLNRMASFHLKWKYFRLYELVSFVLLGTCFGAAGYLQPGVVLPVKVVGLFYFFMALLTYISLWVQLRKGLRHYESISLLPFALFAVYYTAGVFNMSVLFSFSILVSKSLVYYFSVFFELSNLAYFTSLLWKLSEYRSLKPGKSYLP